MGDRQTGHEGSPTIHFYKDGLLTRFFVGRGADRRGDLRLSLQDFPRFCKSSVYSSHWRNYVHPRPSLQRFYSTLCLLSQVHFSSWCFYPLFLISPPSSCLSLSFPLAHGNWVKKMQNSFSYPELWWNVLGERGPKGLSTYQRHISIWVVNFLFRQPFSSPEAQLKLASCGLGKPPGSRIHMGTPSLTFSSLESQCQCPSFLHRYSPCCSVRRC